MLHQGWERRPADLIELEMVVSGIMTPGRSYRKLQLTVVSWVAYLAGIHRCSQSAA